MFGFSKNKAERAQSACGVALDSLRHQVASAVEGEEDRSVFGQRLLEPYARGYVFGSLDLVIHQAGVTRETAAAGELALAHNALFGVRRGWRLFGQALMDQEDQEFSRGRQAGTQEMLNFLHYKIAPHGLHDFLLRDKSA